MNKLFSILAVLLLFTFGCTQGTTKYSTGASSSNNQATNNAQSNSGIPYNDFSQSAYQQALKDHKVIYLEFYAGWCPTCTSQEPYIKQAFSEMSPSDYPNLVAFKVDYDNSQDLKSQYGVLVQHTHILIGKDGRRVYKSNNFWSADDIKSIMKKLVNGELNG